MNKNNILKNIGKVIGIYLIFEYSWLLQLIPVAIFGLDVNKLSDKAGVALTTFSSFCIAIIFFFIFRKQIIEEAKKFKENFWKCCDVGIFYYIIGLSLMVVSNVLISVVFSAGGAANEDGVQNMISSFPSLMILSAGILAPWNEELIFRKTVKDLFKNKWLYVIVSGLLFGLAHVVGQTTVWTDWLYVIPYGVLGCSFAASYFDTKTIFTPILFHMIHNLVLIITSII